MAADPARELFRSAVSGGIPALSPTEAHGLAPVPCCEGPVAQVRRTTGSGCPSPSSLRFRAGSALSRLGVMLPPKAPLCPSPMIRHLPGFVLPAHPILLAQISPGEETQEAAPFGQQSEGTDSHPDLGPKPSFATHQQVS